MRRLCSIPVVVLSLLLFVFSPRRLPPPPCHFPLLPVVSPAYSSFSFLSCLSSSSSCPSSSSSLVLFLVSPFLLHLLLVFSPSSSCRRVSNLSIGRRRGWRSHPTELLGCWGVASFARSSSYRPSSRFSPPPPRLTTLPPCRLYPSSLGYALCRWVMPFVVGLCPSSLWPGCGRRLAGPYSSLWGRRLSSGRRWSSVRRLSSGHCLPW